MFIAEKWLNQDPTLNKGLIVNPQSWSEFLSLNVSDLKRIEILDVLLSNRKDVPSFEALRKLLVEDEIVRKSAFLLMRELWLKTWHLPVFDFKWTPIKEFSGVLSTLFEQVEYITEIDRRFHYYRQRSIPSQSDQYETYTKIGPELHLLQLAENREYIKRKNEILAVKNISELSFAEWFETLGVLSVPGMLNAHLVIPKQFKSLKTEEEKAAYTRMFLREIDPTLSYKHKIFTQWIKQVGGPIVEKLDAEQTTKRFTSGLMATDPQQGEKNHERKAPILSLFGNAWMEDVDDEERIMAPIREMGIYIVQDNGDIRLTGTQGDFGSVIGMLRDKGYIDMQIVLRELPQRLYLKQGKNGWYLPKDPINKLIKIISGPKTGAKGRSPKLHKYLENLKNHSKSVQNTN